MCLKYTHHVFFTSPMVSRRGMYHPPKIVLYYFYQKIQNVKKNFCLSFWHGFYTIFHGFWCTFHHMCTFRVSIIFYETSPWNLKKRIFGLLIYIVTRVSLLQFSRILFRAFVRKLLITVTIWRMSLKSVWAGESPV